MEFDEMPMPATPTLLKKTTPEKSATISHRQAAHPRQSGISKKKSIHERQNGPIKRRSSPEKCNPKPRASSGQQSAQSILELRFTDGSPSKSSATNLAFKDECEEDFSRNGNAKMNKMGAVMDTDCVNSCSLVEEDLDCLKVDNDSPYRSTYIASDEMLSKSKKSQSGEPPAWFPEKLSSLNESRWSDTCCYGAKKRRKRSWKD